MGSISADEIGVAVIGFGWMGRVHTHAYTRVHQHFAEPAVRARLVAVADDTPGRAEAAAARYGFGWASTDWRDVLRSPEVEAVSVTAPNFLHREIGAAVAEAGKHLWIEKPVGTSSRDAAEVAAAVTKGGVRSAVGFNYRNAPAVVEARRMIHAGEIGRVTHASVRMLGDYAADESGAFTWRYQLAEGGHGVVGDLASHGVDLVRHLLGEVREVVADSAVFVKQRRRASGPTTGHARADAGELVSVENEDWVAALLSLESGARVALECSRVATGRQNDYGVRVHGTRGAVEWDFRRMGVLGVAQGRRASDLPLAERFVGPESGDFAGFQPAAGNPMSYDDLKVIEAHRFLTGIATGRPDGADIADAVAAAEVTDAIIEAAATGCRVVVGGR